MSDLTAERTRIPFDYHGFSFDLLYPEIGPSYNALGLKLGINENGFVMASAAEAVSALVALLSIPLTDYYRDKTIHMLRTTGLWLDTACRFVPEKGMYIEDHPEIEKVTAENNSGRIIERFKDVKAEDLSKRFNEGEIGFVPLTNLEDEVTPIRVCGFARYPLVQTLFHEEAERLGDIASGLNGSAYVSVLRPANPVTKFPVINIRKDGGLQVRLFPYSGTVDGSAFAVSRRE